MVGQPDHHTEPGQPPLAELTFEQAAAEVGRRCQSAVNALLADLSEASPIRTGPELSSALDIDINLSWKLLALGKPGAGVSGLLRMPGDGAVRILLTAAKRKGVSPSTLEEIRTAFEGYESLIHSHAGSRAALESLLAHASSGPQCIDLATRRAAFRANSTMLGVQAAVQVAAYMFWPEVHEGQASSAMAIVRGLGDFRRLRSDVPWIIGRGRRTDSQGRLYGQPFPVPIDPEIAREHGGVPLLRAFSSGNVPAVRRSITADGLAVDRLLAGPVGLRGAQSIFLGETMRPGLAPQNDPAHPALKLVVSVHTPCELLVFDAFFHKDLPPLGPPSVLAGTELGGDSLAYCPPADRVLLQLGVEIEDHGLGLRTAHIAELPRYPEMIDSTCRKLQVHADDLRLFRVKLAFPPIPSSVMIERFMREG
jgi:hypothetical protein